MPTTLDELIDDLDAGAGRDAAGAEMYRFVERAFPICRSITGDGVRETLAMAAETAPVEVHEVATGTPVLDWTVPREWNVRDAWIKGPGGDKVVDFRDHNLHLLGYSVPVHRRLPLAELREHLFSLPDRPDLIPYRTSYYRESWGFCLPHRRLAELAEGDYEVRIDATLEDGSLTYGEVLLRGSSEQEVLLSCHVCHPSLANDNLSALAVSLGLARRLAEVPRRYSYRFVYVPGTIGAITWLARNPDAADRVAHGLVMANLGDPGGFCYKRSRRGDATIDRAVVQVLRDGGEEHEIEDFVPFGYDERQYGSPGFDLPVGSLTRTPWGRYPEYHTSADDLDLVTPEALAGSLATYLKVFAVLEAAATDSDSLPAATSATRPGKPEGSSPRYLNLSPRGEPQLGRRGLYRSIGGGEDGRDKELALLWVLNLGDGEHSLQDVAERSGMSLAAIHTAYDALLDAELVRPISEEET
jgi:aminopeptidase-like protein